MYSNARYAHLNFYCAQGNYSTLLLFAYSHWTCASGFRRIPERLATEATTEQYEYCRVKIRYAPFLETYSINKMLADMLNELESGQVSIADIL